MNGPDKWWQNEQLLTGIREWFGITPEHAIRHVGFRSQLPPVVLLAMAVAVVALATWLYWREQALPRWLRVFLASLRVVSCLVVLLFLACPFVSLERRVTIRRNLLVMVDRSRSMGIEDKRTTPESVGDAALALGKASHPLPAEHKALVRAHRSALRSREALEKRNDDDVMRAMAEADVALASVPTRQDKELPPAAASAVAEVQSIRHEQNGLRESIRSLTDRGGLNESRYQELAAAQAAIAEKIISTLEKIRQLPVAVPAETQGQVARSPRIALAAGLAGNHDPPVLEEVAAACNVHGFVFGDKLEATGTGAEAVIRGFGTTKATDDSTRGGDALEEAIAKHSGQPLAGVVLITDGAFNAGTDPLEVARRMKEQNIPLYPVGIGLEAPRDIALRFVIVPEAVFPEDKVTARVQVFSSGYRGQPVAVRLRLDGKEAASKTVELTDSNLLVDLPFDIPKGVTGAKSLVVEATPQPDEQTDANNRIERTLKVIDQKIKVLYVEGKPRWEYRYLRVVLQRDQRLDVKFLLTQGDKELAGASPEYLGYYPDKPDEAFQFDLVILGEVPSWYFDQAQLERMVRHVRERGGALLMLAGDRYAPATYGNTPLGEVLPVRTSEDPATQVPESWFPAVTPAGKRSFPMLAPSDEATAAVWSLVRPLYRLPSLAGPKPGAHVLLEVPRPGEEPYPLLAWHYAGTGKVMFVGTDQLWRLRLMRGDQNHMLFWGKAIQFLSLSRLLGENKRIRLEVDRTECRAGEPVEIHANVLDDSYQPSTAKDYTVRLERLVTGNEGGTSEGTSVVASTQPLTLAAVPGSPGLFQCVARPEETGHYQVKARIEDKDFANVVDLAVRNADREQQEPAMQAAVLGKMAELSGGRYFSIRDWPSLPGVIEARDSTALERKDKEIWDIWPLYVALVSCAGLEWFIRRKRYLL